MACPTCGHTMQNVGVETGPAHNRRVFWCPRCGTLRDEFSNSTGAQTNDEAPQLVARCREFEEVVPNRAGALQLWKNLGIAEAIYSPNERP